MNYYRSYQLEDFACDESFRQWVLEHEPNNTQFWQQWLAENPDCREKVHLAKAFLLALEENETDLSELELDDITEQILQAPPQTSSRFWQFPLFQWAASIVLLLGIGWGAYSYFRPSSMTAEESEMVMAFKDDYLEQTNQTDRVQRISLQDGSTIALYPKSRIRYPQPFRAQLREVYLEGKAFFDITKNPQQPFWVYTDYISTQVLGTSFMVQAFSDAKEAKVVVKTGRVSVYTRKDLEKAKTTQQAVKAGVVLTPNQQVAFSIPEKRFLKSIVEVPTAVVLAPVSSYSFEETPVTQVFDFVEKTYGISVIYDAKALEGCYLTATLSDESMFDKLDLICKITHSTYEIVDAQIIIHSRGCK
ncbi:MAG TPA: iron dicitrate transport regulator FecR [Runella sp.]|nr:iron dicitrate transport regulator FecR [Runella sp.]